jgi:apolipoprotein N-acyltransferase
VQLVQGQVLQNEKFSKQRDVAYRWYLNQLKNSDAQLTILPETALPYFESQLPLELWRSMLDELKGTNKLWIMGLISGSEKGYTNTAIGTYWNVLILFRWLWTTLVLIFLRDH